MDNIPEALKLLVVGMVTVFLILLIVINLGKALIAIINKIAPEEELKKQPAVAKVAAVDGLTKSVIEEAVNQLTAGKGHVTNIQKL